MNEVDDVQAHLASLGLVDGVSGWPSVRRRAHDDTQRLVIITEDGGLAPEVGADDGESGDAAMAFPQVQVRVRAEPWEADDAKAQLNLIRDALHGRFNELIGSTIYLRTGVLTSAPALFYDSKGRPNFTLSFQLTRAEPAIP